MNDVGALALVLLLACCPYSLVQAEASEPKAKKFFTLGAAVGYHDVDSDDSADPHVNGYTYALLVGYDWSRYVGVDAELMRMNGGLMWMFSAGGYPLAQMRSVSRHVSNGP